jgi:ribosomal protein S6--L-glutamate ligase/gamma-F420-2:alpha-L-glutamate ligase
VIEIANDKLITYNYFKDHFPMLQTEIFTGGENYPYVVKDRFGHGGTQVYLINQIEDIQDFFYTENFIQQPLGPQPGKDLRVYILNNEIIASVLRSHPTDFRSNYSLGGNIELYTLDEAQEKAVKRILNILPLDYGGIDFLFDENNQLILNEIEDVVGARMLYNLKQIPMVEMYLSHIKNKISKQKNI